MAVKEKDVKRKKKKKKKSLKAGLFIGLAALISTISIAVAAALHAPALIADFAAAPPATPVVEAADTQTIAAGVFIDGINVAGMTVYEALERLNREIRDVELLKELNLIHNDTVFTYTFGDFDAQHDFQAALDYAYTIGRERPRTGRINIDSAFYFNTEAVSAVLARLVNEINREPVDATMQREDGDFVITPEITGLSINQHRLVEDLLAAIEDRQAADIIIEVDVIIPDFTEDIFERSTDLLGSFYTIISGNDPGRNQNLLNASSKINNYMVFPGEIFSTNRAFGEMTYANGYRMAPVIINGELVPGMGGGICQISTNLYIALVFAELNIVERRNHSLRVGYADYGWDATLATGLIDLRFENDTGYPVLIESYIYGNRTYVHIFGNDSRSPGRRLELFSTVVERIPPPEETIIEDETMPYGERLVTLTALQGVVAELWKIVFEGDRELYRERVNISRYRARAAVVRVGTGEPADDAPQTAEAVGGNEPMPPNAADPAPVAEPPQAPQQSVTQIVDLNPLPPAPPVLPPDLGQFVAAPTVDDADRPPVVD